MYVLLSFSTCFVNNTKPLILKTNSFSFVSLHVSFAKGGKWEWTEEQKEKKHSTSCFQQDWYGFNGVCSE